MHRDAQSTLIRALRWTERYTKTDMVYLASGGMWSVIGQIASSLMVFILAMMVARYLPKDAYGTYKFIISAVAILGVFSLNGLGTALFQSIAHGYDGALQDGFRQNLRWSALMIVGTIAVSLYYFHAGNATLAIGILIGGCLSPLLTSANFASSFLIAKRNFHLNGIYFGLIDTIVPATALILTVFLSNDPLVLVSVYFLANTLSTLALYFLVIRRYRPDPKKTDPGMLTYGKHLSAIGILGVLASNVDQILLFHFGGAIDLAVYNFAVAIPDQSKGPLKMFDSMTQAGFAKRTDAEILSGTRHKLFVLSIVYISAIAVYWVLAPYIFQLFFPNYLDAVFYSQIYMLSFLLYPLDIAKSYLTVKKKVRQQYISKTVASLFKLGAMVIGVIWWGLLGLIVARVASRWFTASLSYLLYSFSVRGSEKAA